jgi:hypothetical protein
MSDDHRGRGAGTVNRLWRQQGKPDPARELLAPLYGCFTEGLECADLKEARAELEQLEMEAGAA